MKGKRVSQKSQPSAAKNGMIDFNYGNTLYQIDPKRRKVYRRWIEVETSKTFLIMGAFNSSQARAH